MAQETVVVIEICLFKLGRFFRPFLVLEAQ
jgi:hypothetical protein